MMIVASEHLRRCLETVLRLHEAMWTIDRLERFHDMVIAEVQKLAPEVPQQLMAELERLSQGWMRTGGPPAA
jgi:hypothetical protein